MTQPKHVLFEMNWPSYFRMPFMQQWLVYILLFMISSSIMAVPDEGLNAEVSKTLFGGARFLILFSFLSLLVRAPQNYKNNIFVFLRANAAAC